MANIDIQSRHKFKKLGTILEHLLNTVDLDRYYITQHGMPRVGTPDRQILIQIWPLGIVAHAPVWSMGWNRYFNSKIYINEYILSPGAEW